MCGIAGIWAYGSTAQPLERDELVRMRDYLAARGPDGKGEWVSADRRLGLGHRRLSIIDLSEAGAQPMASADGSLVVTFNGEIYNYRALRRDLEAQGCIFRSHSDTEVLLHLYALKGASMVSLLRGMFAFAIWDERKRGVLLARDPFGIKPLYYADDGRALRFASQVKALLAGRGVASTPDPAGYVGFCLFGSVPEPFTMHREIRALPAGSTAWIDASGMNKPWRYFSIAETYCRAEAAGSPPAGRAVQEHVREALLDSVRHHLIADVPVGAFLSSGIDSGSLVGLMRKAGQQDIQTVTLTFDEFRGKREDEAPLAELVAQRYGTRHTTRVVSEQEFRDDLPRILEAMDQPSIDGLNTWFVSKAARELGLKVAVSGLGGDELFGGYSSFREVPRWVRTLKVPASVPGAGWSFRALMSGLTALLPGVPSKTAGLVELGGTYAGAYLLRRALFLPWELPEVIEAPEIVREGLARLDPLRHVEATLSPRPRTAFAKVATLESSLYMRNQLLRDADWAGMAHSLEIRVPLVDSELLTRMAPFTVAAQRQSGKRLLTASLERALPEAIVARPKTGFATPLGQWLERSPILQRTPSGTRTSNSQPWGRRWLRTIAETSTCGLASPPKTV